MANRRSGRIIQQSPTVQYKASTTKSRTHLHTTPSPPPPPVPPYTPSIPTHVHIPCDCATVSPNVKCKRIKDSLGIWDSTPWIPDSRYGITDFLSVERGFPIPIVSGIPDSLIFIPDSKAQDSGFYKLNFQDSGIRISLHGASSLWSVARETGLKTSRYLMWILEFVGSSWK